MAKRQDSPNIVIVPTVAFPAKKPVPPLPSSPETIILDDISSSPAPSKKRKLDNTPEAPPAPAWQVVGLDDSPALASNSKVTPLNKRQSISDKNAIETLLSEEPNKTVASTTASNSIHANEENVPVSDVEKCEVSQSENSPNKRWASYLASIGQESREPIRIKLTRRNSLTPLKDEDMEKYKCVEMNKTKLPVMQQLFKDKPQIPNHNESEVTEQTNEKPLTMPMNDNLHNLSNTLPPPNYFGIPNSICAHGHQYLPISAPLNYMGCYNYNISNNVTPTLLTPVTPHAPYIYQGIDYCCYNARTNHNYENTVYGSYQSNPHNNNDYYKSYHSTDQAAKDKSYLDMKIDEFLAKVSRDRPCGSRCDETKTRKDITPKRSSLKRRASDLEPCRDSYQEDWRDEVNKKKRISVGKQTKECNITEKKVSNTNEKDKTNIKDDMTKENYKDYRDYKRDNTNKDDAIKEKMSSEDTGDPKKSIIENAEVDDYSSNKKDDSCKLRNKKENDKRERRSHSDSESDSTPHSSRRSEESVRNESTNLRVNKQTSLKDKLKYLLSLSSRNSQKLVIDDSKTKRVYKGLTSKNKEKSSSFYGYRRSEEHEKNKEKSPKAREKSSSPHSSRRSEERDHKSKKKQENTKDKEKFSYHDYRRSEEHNKSNTKLINKEKSPKAREKYSSSYSSRRSEEHYYQSKAKTRAQDKKKSSWFHNFRRSEEYAHFYETLREKIKLKIKKAEDETKQLQREAVIISPKNTSSDNKPKKPDYKHSASKLGNDSNIEIRSINSLKSVVKVNNNFKLQDIDKHFDLRTHIQRRNADRHFSKIRGKNRKPIELSPEKRDNLIITVPNDDVLQVEENKEQPTKNTQKVKNKKNKKMTKIHLVINVPCDESDTSESEENAADTEKDICSSFNADDLSFLDDINIDEIVNCLKSNQKESNSPKISANNDIATFIVSDDDSDASIISDDDSEASTVHLDEVVQTVNLDDYDQFIKTEIEDQEHKHMLRDLVNNNMQFTEQRLQGKKKVDFTENADYKMHENNDTKPLNKIKEEVSDNINCTKLNVCSKKTETITSETTSAKVGQKAMSTKLFTPMMDIKEEPIEILSDDEILINDTLEISKLEDHEAAKDKLKLGKNNTSTSLTKISTITQSKTDPVNIEIPSTLPITIKTEPKEIEENISPIINTCVNSNIPKLIDLNLKTNKPEETTKDYSSTKSNAMQQLKIKDEPKYIEDKPEKLIEPKRTSNSISKEIAIIPLLEIKTEPEETEGDKEVSLDKDTKASSMEIVKHIETTKSKTYILPEIENCNDKSKSQCPERAMTDIRNESLKTIGIFAKLENKISDKETRKVRNRKSVKGTTDAIQATCDTSKTDNNKDKDATIENGDIADETDSNKEHSVKLKQLSIKEKDNDKINEASNKVTKANRNQLGILRRYSSECASKIALNSPKISSPASTLGSLIPKSANLTNIPETAGSISNQKSASPAIHIPNSLQLANLPKKSGLLPTSKNCSANTITSTKSSSSSTSKSTSIVNNPEIKNANDEKALEQNEQVFINNLKKKMQETLKVPYQIIELIHTGQFSKIFKCSDGKGNDTVVKVMGMHCDRYEMGVLKEEMLEKLQNTIPDKKLNIIRLYDGFTVEKQWAFLMEYYPKNLSQALGEREQPFDITHVKLLSRQLVGAVAALRKQNIVHSDIKPSHVMLSGCNNRLKLCGFDEASYGVRNPLPNIGTVNYRAPEIILGFSAGFSIDVWSTALVMYEMATKIQLFPGVHNNDILFKQMCTLGYVPPDMLALSRYAHVHFDGDKFMRRCGQKVVPMSADQIFQNNRLLGSLWAVYHNEWGNVLPQHQRKPNLTKLYRFGLLLQQMLVVHPTHRYQINDSDAIVQQILDLLLPIEEECVDLC